MCFQTNSGDDFTFSKSYFFRCRWWLVRAWVWSPRGLQSQRNYFPISLALSPPKYCSSSFCSCVCVPVHLLDCFFGPVRIRYRLYGPYLFIARNFRVLQRTNWDSSRAEPHQAENGSMRVWVCECVCGTLGSRKSHIITTHIMLGLRINFNGWHISLGKAFVGVRINHQLEPMKLKFIYYFAHTHSLSHSQRAHSAHTHIRLVFAIQFYDYYYLLCAQRSPITIMAWIIIWVHNA